jgi:hypothetical protein
MKYLMILFFTFSIFAQETGNDFSGILSLDSRLAFKNPDESNLPESPDIPGRKSPVLAGVLSFAVPGAGEFYSESYIKSAIFFVAEVAAVSSAIIYNSKGDDQTQTFENFANEHWSANQYAQWTLLYFSSINIVDPQDYNNLISNGNVNWPVLNNLEEKVSQSDIGKYYSHKLAPYGDQQYYEMIGKYRQFNVGWDDLPGGVDGTYNYQTDPVTPRYDKYSVMRGKANDYYNIASTAVTIVVVNHILSAIDAVWSASRYNKALTTTVSMKKANHGFVVDIYPELNMSYRF